MDRLEASKIGPRAAVVEKSAAAATAIPVYHRYK
jgi:hypothetical protein